MIGVAALPISELRGAIPIAIVSYNMEPIVAYALAVLGNLIPVVLILALLDTAVKLFSRIEFFRSIIEWVFSFTRRRHNSIIARWGKAVALVIIVAIPLPMTGAWTGSLVAYLFGIPNRLAFPMIAIGVLIAGILVTLGTLGFIEIF